MEWKKAKTILIVVFIVVNIFLTYELMQIKNTEVQYIGRKEMEGITTYLEDGNIFVQGKMPDKTKNIPSIIVKYKQFPKETIAAAIFEKNEKYTTNENNGTVIMESSDKLVQIKNNRELTYLNKRIEKSQEPAQDNTYKENTKNFLSKLGITIDKSFSEKTSEQDGFYKTIYTQKYLKVDIIDSLVEISANEQGVREARIICFDSIKPLSVRDIKANSATALYSFRYFFKDNKEKITIYDMQQIYYIDTKSVEQFDIKKIEEGTAFPAWRIKSSKGTFFVNGYTGKIEN